MATDNVPVMFHRLFSQSGAFICAPRPMRSLVRAPFKIGRNYGNAVDILRSANITNYHGRHTRANYFFLSKDLYNLYTHLHGLHGDEDGPVMAADLVSLRLPDLAEVSLAEDGLQPQSRPRELPHGAQHVHRLPVALRGLE